MSIRLRRLARSLFDFLFGPILRLSMELRELRVRSYNTEIYDLARKRAVESSLDYTEANMQSALMFKTPVGLWDYALSETRVAGLCLEFGVWKGRSINHFAEKLPEVYGFDSFEGLQEDWKGAGLPKGAFDLQGRMPKVAPNVHLIKGWFTDTVPIFLAGRSDVCSFVHIDCDTFESATIVLDLVGPRLVPGTVVIFDEYFGYRGWQYGEFKAWSDYVQRTGTRYEYLGFAVQQVAIKIQHT